ncbi:hypothetical protein BVC80_1829g43 [Macleaya cordata]|uniref:Uncharacterized protein n=1 Tax=Macleaya cordata TaxID=56857 RepID=A0A200QZ80_MACCD|nr:hypothetical protein BVC80_1829g43 [Macleaya cordata]
MEEGMNRPMIVGDPPCSLSVLRVLILATDLVLTPVIVDIIAKIAQLQDLVEPNKEIIDGILKNFRLLLGTAETQLNSKGWLAKIDGSWKRPLINWFYVILIYTVVVTFVLILIKENLDGVGTVARTEDHIRGRRLQGFGLTLISSIVSVAIFTGFGFGRNQINRGTGSEFVTEIVALGYVCMKWRTTNRGGRKINFY